MLLLAMQSQFLICKGSYIPVGNVWIVITYWAKKKEIHWTVEYVYSLLMRFWIIYTSLKKKKKYSLHIKDLLTSKQIEIKNVA